MRLLNQIKPITVLALAAIIYSPSAHGEYVGLDDSNTAAHSQASAPFDLGLEDGKPAVAVDGFFVAEKKQAFSSASESVRTGAGFVRAAEAGDSRSRSRSWQSRVSRNETDSFWARLGKMLIAPIAGPIVGVVSGWKAMSLAGVLIGIGVGLYYGVGGFFLGGIDKDFIRGAADEVERAATGSKKDPSKSADRDALKVECETHGRIISETTRPITCDELPRK